MKINALIFLAFGLSAVPLGAGDLALSDPANTPPPPVGAIGFPNRAPDFDARAGFQKPPPGYGEVGFYWWLGDALTKDRLTWQLDQLADKGIMGLQINYAHSDKGGRSYGFTYPSDPPIFSEKWWDLVGWFMKEAKRRGMAVSLSDYTLGFGQGYYVDEIIKEDPSLNGATLVPITRDHEGGTELAWALPTNTLSVVAFRRHNGALLPGSGIDLRPNVTGTQLRWAAPPGPWHVVVVGFNVSPWSIDPMNPRTGKQVVAKFFQPFENRNPGEGGKGLNFFFSDELGFGVHGNLWTARFADEFKRRKGYDLVPELAALFVDVGPRTPKVRLDYRDVMVALEEEGYFKPVFDWHQQRGMIYGCDHGGRGYDVVEFGDYFRAMRWYQGPGNDQPNLGTAIVRTKVSSSIAHLYERPRCWLEGFYGSGWGTTPAQVAEATFRNFVHGQNLLTLHGLYYSTHGGYWEWAPPCNHFHMPYWPHMGEFLHCAERLSFLLSQGVHRCDVAILYPVAPMEAGMDGDLAVKTAFSLGEQLVKRGIDLDFIDFESVARAKVEGQELCVSGEAYRVLILPAMKAVRFSTLEKTREFHRAGGKVLAVGALPMASDRTGRQDAAVTEIVKEIFGQAPTKVAEVEGLLGSRDYAGPGEVLHRVIGPRDVYFVYGAAKNAECSFRAKGRVELWNPWDGQSRAVPVISQDAEGTQLHAPLDANEPQLFVFSPGTPELEQPAVPSESASIFTLDGDWEFELRPSLDNRFGDYHWPPTPTLVGAEARQLEYAAAGATNGPWRRVTCSFGPKFWKLGPLPNGFNDALLVGLDQVDPSVPVQFGGKEYQWQPYEFSWRWGREGDPGHQGWHGLKENITDEFICLGAPRSGLNETLYGPEPAGTRYYLWTSVPAQRAMPAYPCSGGLKPSTVWFNHTRADQALTLQAGANPLLLRYDKPGRGYFVVSETKLDEATSADSEPFSALAQWIWYPQERVAADRWFRKAFDLEKAPAEARLRITCDNGYAVSINGHPVGRGDRWEFVQEYPIANLLRVGRNEIVVRATNTGDAAGLVAEVTAGTLCVATDHTWEAAKTESGPSVAAEVVAGFRDSLWFNHQMGPPKLEAVDSKKQPEFKESPLRMSWYNQPGILPFDTQPQTLRPTGWYRFTSPPGLRAFTVATKGKAQAWANGQELKAAAGSRFVIAQPTATPVEVRLRIENERGSYGGAALLEPVQLECGPGRIVLGDWAKIDGLLSYSGGAWYRKTVSLPSAKSVIMNLGNVVASAEVRINGQSAGIRVAPPWSLDITRLVKPGENQIEILVFNTLANHYTTIPTHYRGSTVSGLLGPVTVHVTR